jgi:isochorismate hydrolase
MTTYLAPISSYPLPAGNLPPQQVPWRPDHRRAALLIHDMQRYFLRPFAGAGPVRDALTGNIVRLRDACAARQVPVLYTAQPGGMTASQRGLLRAFWGPGMTAEKGDREIVPELAPRPGDRVLTKWRYSAFHRTGLVEALHDLGRDQLLICGVYAHMGCLVTAIDAFSHDIEAFLIADAVADLSAEYHRLALTFAAERCAATPTTLSALESLGAGHDD